MRTRVAVLVVVLLTLLTACGSASGTSASAPAKGQELAFTASTVDGASFQGSSLEGKPTVLWFWAPWCPTCRRQAPGVADLVNTFGDKVNVVGVGSLDDASAIKDFADKVPADMPQLLDPDGAVWRHFGITEQSTYVVLDKDSDVVSSGSLTDSALKDMVAGLVG